MDLKNSKKGSQQLHASRSISYIVLVRAVLEAHVQAQLLASCICVLLKCFWQKTQVECRPLTRHACHT